MTALTRNWDMRLHFDTGVEFVNARKLVENGNIEFETESVTDPIPRARPMPASMHSSVGAPSSSR